ncbi:MAG: hypothetical protein ACJ8FA_03990 [Xanthobacteraceae bacterium]
MPANAKASGQVRQVGKTSGPALKRYLGATVRTADRIDYWIRQHVIERPPGLAGHINELRSAQAQASAPAAAATRASARHAIPAPRAVRPLASKLMLACDRRAWLSALGQSLKGQYDALAAPVPPRLAARVRQHEAQDQTSGR